MLTRNTSGSLGERYGTTIRRRMFPQLFRVAETFYYSVKTRRTCFLLLLENTAAKKENNFFTLIIKMQTLLAWTIIASKARDRLRPRTQFFAIRTNQGWKMTFLYIGRHVYGFFQTLQLCTKCIQLTNAGRLDHVT